MYGLNLIKTYLLKLKLITNWKHVKLVVLCYLKIKNCSYKVTTLDATL